MSAIFPGRWTSRAKGDFVIFLIGMRINKPLAFSQWRPVAKAMPAMQQELGRHPELGCIHTENWFGRTTISLQYWKDFESLRAYARNPNQATFPPGVHSITPSEITAVWASGTRHTKSTAARPKQSTETCLALVLPRHSTISLLRKLATARLDESVPTLKTTPRSIRTEESYAEAFGEGSWAVIRSRSAWASAVNRSGCRSTTC